MKKLLGIMVLGLLWCNVGNAGINEPGTDQQCFDLFEKKKVFKEEFLPAVNKDTHIFIVYTSCTGDYKDWEWGWTIGLDTDSTNKSAYNKCLSSINPKNEEAKKEKKKFPGCFLYAIDDQIVWGQDVAVVKKIVKDAKAKSGSMLAQKNEEKKPISPESISEWDYTCDKEDFKKYVATVEGCMALHHLGKIDKSKKKLVVFMHGDYKGKQDNDIKGWWTFSGVIKDEKKNINFFYLARPGHKFKGRSRSPGKYKNYEVQNIIEERVAFKKGWQAIRLISQTLYRLKEFYQPDQLIVIGFSGGSNDIGVISGKVPGLIDVGIMGGCDCLPHYAKGRFWYPGEFIKTIDPKAELILITGKSDKYAWMVDEYVKMAKEAGLNNVQGHVVKGGHEKNVLLKYGKEIVQEALK